MTALPDRYPVAAATLAAILVLGTAYGFQFAGYPPCEMCWWQRYPYMAAIAFGVVALLLGRAGDQRLMWAFALLFLTTSVIGAFHAGVENKWWDGPAHCSGALNLTGSVEDALAALQDAPLVRCDAAAWRLFGISMAGYNAMVGLALAFFSLRAARRKD